MSNLSYEERLFNAIKNGQATVKSVYDIWLELGNEGTAQDFLDTLKGSTARVISNVTVPASGWSLLPNGLYKTTLTDETITAKDVINVEFNVESIIDATNSGVLGYTNSVDGGFELFSNFAPTMDLLIDYAVIPHI